MMPWAVRAAWVGQRAHREVGMPQGGQLREPETLHLFHLLMLSLAEGLNL